MKNALRSLFAPVLNVFEKGTDEYVYKPSHRTILLVVGTLFAALAAFGPQEQQSPLWQERWNSAIARTLQHITSHELSALSRTTETLAEIALACALGYLNFRLPQLAWAEAHPALKEWFETVSRVPSLSDTAPAD